MRQFVLLLLLCAGSFSIRAGAATAPPVAAEHPMQAAYAKLLTMKPAAIEKKLGRKLTFKEKIQVRIAKLHYSLTKRYAEGEPSPKQLKQGRLALVLGGLGFLILALAAAGAVLPGLIVLFTLPLGVGALILGIRSAKGNGNTAGVLGIASGGAILFIWLLAVILIAAILYTWE